jgi:hypothetical protein
MNVEIISLFYKDYFLSQFYLRHYDWADKITLITKTLTEGINNEAQVSWYNEAYRNSKADWIIACDFDEFAFVSRATLEKVPSNINVKKVKLFDIYPHASENPNLDPNIPVKDQRQHGFLMKDYYVKPIIVRGGLNLIFGIGRHGLIGNGIKMDNEDFTGAHWRNCSLEYALETRLKKRKDRFSQEDIKKGYSLRDRLETEESIRKEFKDHENDPQVF